MLTRKYSLRLAVLLPALCLAFSPRTSFAGNDKNYTYLALGDSVAYGLDIRLLPPIAPFPLPDPSVFRGYPEVIADVEHLTQSKKEVNASCPGETSGSFISGVAPDYGCHDLGPQGQPPFKTLIGLHTQYPGSQFAFALSELGTNKHINLVTLQIGSNDILQFLKCMGPNPPSTCAGQSFDTVFATYQTNLIQILSAIRLQYKGTLILVGYYSPSTDFNGIATILNTIMQGVGSSFGASFADGFKAFQFASALSGGDPCKAGLLIPLSATTCDIHPTKLGQDVLAAAVEVAIIESRFHH